jgi:hypothetical protein
VVRSRLKLDRVEASALSRSSAAGVQFKSTGLGAELPADGADPSDGWAVGSGAAGAWAEAVVEAVVEAIVAPKTRIPIEEKSFIPD